MMSVAAVQAQQKVPAAQAKTMIAKINAATKKLKTIDASFTQTKEMKMMKDKMTAEGAMHYDCRGNLKWEYTSPYYCLFSLENNKVTVKADKSKEKSSIPGAKMFQGIAQVMMGSISGKGLQNTSEFDIDMYTQDGQWMAYLSPKKPRFKRFISQMRLFFDKKTLMVNKVVIVEKGGDRTIIEMHNMKTS